MDKFRDISGALFANNNLLNQEDQRREDTDQFTTRRRGNLDVSDVKNIFINFATNRGDNRVDIRCDQFCEIDIVDGIVNNRITIQVKIIDWDCIF